MLLCPDIRSFFGSFGGACRKAVRVLSFRDLFEFDLFECDLSEGESFLQESSRKHSVYLSRKGCAGAARIYRLGSGFHESNTVSP